MSSETIEARAAFDRLLGELRPKLHRYCARMVGSVVDAEDVVQETLVKAIEAFPPVTAIANVEGWLFRIVHNTALDFLRGRARQERFIGDEDMTMIADPIYKVHQRQAAAAGLRTFMRLPAAQRSSVILMDVLGYSLEEIGGRRYRTRVSGRLPPELARLRAQMAFAERRGQRREGRCVVTHLEGSPPRCRGRTSRATLSSSRRGLSSRCCRSAATPSYTSVPGAAGGHGAGGRSGVRPGRAAA